MDVRMMLFMGADRRDLVRLASILFISVRSSRSSSSLVVAGAWATGEGQAYIVWPQHLVRPFSGRHARRPANARGGLPCRRRVRAAFAALGVATLVGLVTPRPQNASVAPLRGAQATGPIALSAPLQGLSWAHDSRIAAGSSR
jgi:hypothetical protein